jgi:hypothetical protein
MSYAVEDEQNYTSQKKKKKMSRTTTALGKWYFILWVETTKLQNAWAH